MKLHFLTIGFNIIWLTFFSFRSICFCCNRLWSSLSRSDSSPDDQFRIGGVTTVGGAGSKTATPKIVVKQELVRNHLVNYFCTVPQSNMLIVQFCPRLKLFWYWLPVAPKQIILILQPPPNNQLIARHQLSKSSDALATNPKSVAAQPVSSGIVTNTNLLF